MACNLHSNVQGKELAGTRPHAPKQESSTQQRRRNAIHLPIRAKTGGQKRGMLARSIQAQLQYLLWLPLSWPSQKPCKMCHHGLILGHLHWKVDVQRF